MSERSTGQWRDGGPTEGDLAALFAEVPVPPGVDRWRDLAGAPGAGSAGPHLDGVGDPVDLDHPVEVGRAGGVDDSGRAVGIRGARSGRRPAGARPSAGSRLEGGGRRPVRRWAQALAAGLATAAVIGVGVAAAALREDPAPQPTPGVGAQGDNQPVSAGPANTAPPSSTPAGSPVPTPAGRATPGPVPSAPAGPGVPAGTPLRDHPGDLHITRAGEVVSDLLITGVLYIEAPDVTVRRVRVQPPADAYFAIRQQAARLTVEDCELGPRSGQVQYGIRQEADGLVVRRCDVHGAGLGIAVSAGATIVDSSLHDLPADASAGVVSAGGGGLTLRNTSILMAASAGPAVALYTDTGPQSGVEISGCLLGGGRFTLQIGSPNSGIRVTGNRFTGTTRFGTVSGWSAGAAGNVWQGNLRDGDGVPVTP